MIRPRLFVELCCGSAAVTLKLLGGRHAVPPISYMGSKRGYAVTILGAMGLRCGIGADSVLLCDAGPWAHVWAVLADETRCHEVASILRGWADEDPRSLWERLREEHRGEWDGWTVERAAGWILASGWSFRPGDMASGFDDAAVRVERGTRWAGPPSRDNIAHRLESVAAWLYVAQRSRGNQPHKGGFQEEGRAYVCKSGPSVGKEIVSYPPDCSDIAPKVGGQVLGGPVEIYAGPAEDLDPPDDCEGVYMFCDPPYSGTTGYAATMPRETVLDVARKWSDAGAVVCVSEAEPLPLDGWHHVEITGARVGQKRTFSRQQREWLTMNREPQHRPAVQRDLFG